LPGWVREEADPGQADACSVPQEARIDCYDSKPDREDRSERRNEQGENQSHVVIHPGAPKE
jgi:hypothetical protein